MSTMWKVVYGKPAPIEVQAENPSWPNQDSEGDTIFVNTHFADIDAAWVKLLDEHRAGLSLAASTVESQQEQLAVAERHLVEASLFYNAACRARREFQELLLRPEPLSVSAGGAE